MIPGLGNRALTNILSSRHSFDDLVSCSKEELSALIKGSKARQAIETLISEAVHFLEKANAEINRLEAKGISVISINDEQYPHLLKLINDAPVFIFAKGNLNLLQERNSVAIVGTRHCTSTGSNIAVSMARKFASLGVNIVSGLAKGIDTAAHQGALEVPATTTAVLVDVDNIYPNENVELAERILRSDGVLVAENSPGVKLVSGLFAARDRLQSALSLAVIPIEADIDSGTMLTAKNAIIQNRYLFCPDIQRVSSYFRGQKEVRGIWNLIDSELARPISEMDYEQIVRRDFPKKIRELFERFQNEQIQQDLFNKF